MFDTIFLDRDGTINDDPLGYINSLSDYHFYDYTFEALGILKKYCNNFVIVTNQSGLAKGKLDINNLNEIHHFVREEFEKRDLNLRAIYFSQDYREDFNSMRKPGIGMFLKAKEDLNIGLKNSLMIGDSIVDIQAAEKVEMKSIFLLSGQGKSYLEDVKRDYKPNLIANNLLQNPIVQAAPPQNNEPMRVDGNVPESL